MELDLDKLAKQAEQIINAGGGWRICFRGNETTMAVYLAKKESMEGAVVLAVVSKLLFCAGLEEGVAQNLLLDYIKDSMRIALGKDLRFEEIDAPESERSRLSS